MRWNEVIRMLVTYGSIAFVTALAVFLFFLVTRRRGKSRRQHAQRQNQRSAVQMAALALLVGYGLALLAVTMLSRIDASFHSLSLQPFASYRAAWNTMSLRQWQMIGLNIFMFVPLGFLLPVAVPTFRTPWKTMAAGLTATLAIELLQAFTGRGIFEFDDILNNVWGCFIGYCLITAVNNLIEVVKYSDVFSDYGKKERRRRVAAALLLSASPLLLYGAVRFVYDRQEFGNLGMAGQPTIRETIRLDESLQSDSADGSFPGEAYVYSTSTFTAEEAQEQAKKVARNSGFQQEIVRSDVYNDNALFFFQNDAGETLSVWMYYTGGLYSASFHDVRYDETAYGDKSAYSQTAAKKRLKEATGVTVPDGADLVPSDQRGRYLWEVDQTQNGTRGGKFGSLGLSINAEGQVCSFNNSIYDLTTKKKVELLSMEQLLQRLRRGNYTVESFQSVSEDEITAEADAQDAPADAVSADDASALTRCELTITSAKLTYRVDTKGFLRPMARLTAVSDYGSQWRLLVSAQ